MWIGTRQQLKKVVDADIVLNGHRISPSPTVTCLGVNIDPELTFASHTKRLKRVAARCFYKLRQLQTIRHSLSADNARMLVHGRQLQNVDSGTVCPVMIPNQSINQEFLKWPK